MTKTMILALAGALLLGPCAAFAHGQAPQATHGGQVQEAHENWVELVVRGADVKLYVLDEARKPVPASRISGTATVLVGGKPYKVQLDAAGGDALQATLPVAATGKTIATVSLKIDDQPATARFSFEA